MNNSKQDLKSVLFITLDSCRFDTFEAANCPGLKSVGPLNKAFSPGNFTYSAHAAMFMGFTPGDPYRKEPYVNPKFCKIFQLTSQSLPAPKNSPYFELAGSNIIDGFKKQGYVALGTGAVDWFNPETPTGLNLTRDFHEFFHVREPWHLREQVKWVSEKLNQFSGRKLFLFMNIGETHVPYFHEGANWSIQDNPCIPFAENNNAAECRRRQKLCLEFIDRLLEPLVNQFSNATTIVCADHGDCWGEDGLWAHGVSHPKTLEVPLLYRLPPKDTL